MKKLAALLALLILTGVGSSALAQDDYKDVLEFSVYGGLGVPFGSVKDWQDSVGAKVGLSVGAEFGYFVKPNIIVGVSFLYTSLGHEDLPVLDDKGMSLRLYNPNVYVKYIFQTESNFEPYVKAHVGLEFPKFPTFVENDEGDRWRQLSYGPCLATGIGAGLFYYTSDWGGLFLEGNYHYAFTDGFEAEYEGGASKYEFKDNLNTLDLHAGVRILFGSGD